MHARQAVCLALIFAAIPLASSRGDGPIVGPPAPAKVRKPVATPPPAPRSGSTTDKPTPATPPLPLPALPQAAGGEKAMPAAPPAPAVTPGSLTEANRTRAGTEARLKELEAPDKKDNPASKAGVEVLTRRLKLLDDWKVAAQARSEAEHPNPSPEQVAADFKAELEKTKALLDGASKTPDALLPEAFNAPAAGAAPKTPEARLAEMKEAIDAARQELKDRAGELEKLKGGEGSRFRTGDPAALRAERDKVHQSLAALAAGRGERDAAVAGATTAEARDLARDRLTNYEWEYRVEAEHLATLEAQVALAGKWSDLGTLQVQAKSSRVDLSRRLVDLMEKRYASQSERQQNDLQRAVAKEETKAEHTDDTLERYRAQRTAELLRLEAQAVEYEKALATTHGNLSVERQKKLADETVDFFEQNLKQPLNDGTVSPLDAIQLKNAFRRIGPLRASIVKGDLAAVRGDLTASENALADVEMSIVNDDRDDRFDREALLDKLPERRHHEAELMLDAMEARHRTLLSRLRDVLQKLARRSEDTQSEIERRIRTLDDEYTFIRTHIFWVRDAEPVGLGTMIHARSEAVRTARALIKLGGELGDRNLWGRIAPDFVCALVGLVILPWPLRLGQRALDRLRLAVPDPTMTPENAPSAVIG